ncbi:hypothetical protein GBA65_18495 [Rubrobacter marinus]|uniref:Major facilitator superfamily (MFS) profile domain-containing protein n=1 Tax=Rubrobacter marinus TaxID=2653852 RepID=A0A6G8Q151_9ACTN|nr:OFA family MFS transporter [Rubrobacter marinus]QIN80175.1 hypothetical protein GBA65_18495 [Rubrobacter marinus]
MVALAAIVVQAGFGSFYAWSVFREPLSAVYGVGVARVNAAFFLANLLSGFAAFGGGLLIRWAGARAVGVLGGVLYGGAIFLAGVFGESLTALYLLYGLSGVGLGLGYVAPVAALPGGSRTSRGSPTASPSWASAPGP